jgi:hypothetical protein
MSMVKVKVAIEEVKSFKSSEESRRSVAAQQGELETVAEKSIFQILRVNRGCCCDGAEGSQRPKAYWKPVISDRDESSDATAMAKRV